MIANTLESVRTENTSDKEFIKSVLAKKFEGSKILFTECNDNTFWVEIVWKQFGDIDQIDRTNLIQTIIHEDLDSVRSKIKVILPFTPEEIDEWNYRNLQ